MKTALRSIRSIILKTRLTLLILLGFWAAQTFSAAAPNQPKNPPCSEFDGTFVFTAFGFTSPTTASGDAEIWRNGELVGHAHADYSNIQQMGQGVFQMTGIHVQTYLDGSTVVTHDEIRMENEKSNPLWARISSRLYVVDGSGRFAGASGLFHTHGEVNLVTLEGSIDFKGSICVPE